MKAHCLPFSQIPHTTALFSDFLAYTPSIQSFILDHRSLRSG